jgi:hypothetical protein
MAKGHIMVLPFPAQGHVVPLMELSHRLVNHGFEVTFVNTEVNHALVLVALPTSGPDGLHGIHLASIPDGLADDEDRKDLSKLIDAFSTHMSAHLEKLVGEMEAAGRPRVKWLVGDQGPQHGVVLRGRRETRNPCLLLLAGVRGVPGHHAQHPRTHPGRCPQPQGYVLREMPRYIL